LAVAEEMGQKAEVVLYMKEPPSREDLDHLVEIIEDPVEDLVRKDSVFKKLELDPEDYVGNPTAVAELLARKTALLQRPIVVKGDRAIVGRPKTKIADFLAK